MGSSARQRRWLSRGWGSPSRGAPTEITEVLDATDRDEWRRWLELNHASKPDVWLVYYRKSSGKERIPYNDAVEEALCFGWIDSQQKNLDSERYVQRFSPRRPGASYSQANKVRLGRLIEQGKVIPEVLKQIPPGILKEDLEVALDIIEAIDADSEASKNFRSLPDDYRRIRVAYIESQRKHGEEAFQQSLRNFVKMTAKGKRIGYIRD